MTLQEKLTEFMDERGFNQSYVSRSTGISQSMLSQWLSGSYKGNSQKINEAVESFINREILKISIYNSSIPFVKTSIASRIFEVAMNCHFKGELGVVFGDAGLGKTTAIEKYSAENPDVILVKVNPSFTKKYLIQEINKKLDGDGNDSIYMMLNEIILRLRNSGRMIIVDQ